MSSEAVNQLEYDDKCLSFVFLFLPVSNYLAHEELASLFL